MNVFAQRKGRPDPEIAEGDATMPDSIRREPRASHIRAVETALTGLEKALPVVNQDVRADPLHPLVGALLNEGQIAAATKAAEEHVKAAQAMADEANARLADAKTWAAHLIENVTAAAVQTARLHAKLRHAHVSMAAIQAEYESDALPPIEAKSPENPVASTEQEA